MTASRLAGRGFTFAYLSSSPGGTYNYEKWQLWRGIADAAAEWDANLIYVAGEEFEYSPQAVLYQLIGAHNVDGLIFWNSFFSPRSFIEDTQAYIDRFRPLPMVSIELAADGCSNLLLDDSQGVRDLLDHLIKGHGYRRIAFINEVRNYAAIARQSGFEREMENMVSTILPWWVDSPIWTGEGYVPGMITRQSWLTQMKKLLRLLRQFAPGGYAFRRM